MLDQKGIKKTLDKLKKFKEEGEEDLGHIKCVEEGRREIRYYYIFKGEKSK